MGMFLRMKEPLDIGLERAFNMALIMASLFSLFNTMLGLKVVSWSRAAAEDVFRLLLSCVLVVIAGIALDIIFMPGQYLPLRFMYAAGALVLISFVAVRYRLRLVTGLASRWITWILRRPDFRRLYTIVGIADDSPFKQGMRVDGLKVLGTVADIPELVKRHDIGVIFYAISKISEADSQRILATCEGTGLHLVMLSDMLRTLHTRLTRELPRCPFTCPYLIGSDAMVDVADPFQIKDAA
jgi:FlaA1/EpsC-like NDP-sugar epimerase